MSKSASFRNSHNPGRVQGINYPLHCASCIPSPYKYHEYNAKSLKYTDWFPPVLKPKNGVIKVAQEPDLGMNFDLKALR